MLYDDLFRSLPQDNPFKNILSPCVVMRVDNVAEYYLRKVAKDHSLFTKDDFPNIAPPFPDMFFEFHVPQWVAPNAGDLGNIGISIHSEEIDNPKWRLSFDSDDPFNQTIDQAKWMMSLNYWVSGGKYMGWLAVLVSSDGRNIWAKEPERQFGNTHGYNIAFLSMSLMHCKNVEIIEHKPQPSALHSQRRHRPRITYNTLEIEPMKKILRTEGRSESTGLKTALHICRGHFKDFSKGKGLFGKYKGLYWWDNQVRGSADQGEARKDYSINLMTAPTDNH